MVVDDSTNESTGSVGGTGAAEPTAPAASGGDARPTGPSPKRVPWPARAATIAPLVAWGVWTTAVFVASGAEPAERVRDAQLEAGVISAAAFGVALLLASSLRRGGIVGVVIALLLTAASAGSAVQYLLAGTSSTHITIAALFVVMAAALGAGALFAWMMRRRAQRSIARARELVAERMKARAASRGEDAT